MSEQNKATIREMVESVLNGRDLAALDRFVAEDYVELDPAPGQGPGREGLRKLFAAVLAAFPDLQWSTEEQIAEGDTVVSRFTWRGTHTGRFGGIGATGRKVSVKGIVIDRLTNGVMAESRILMDELGLLRQLGIIPDASQD